MMSIAITVDCFNYKTICRSLLFEILPLFGILTFCFAQCLIIMHIKRTKMTSLTSFLKGCFLLSLLRPNLPSVGGSAISSDGFFFLNTDILTTEVSLFSD